MRSSRSSRRTIRTSSTWSSTARPPTARSRSSASYAHHIETLISEPDHGLYDSVNKGLRLATGDVVGFLHADDVLRTGARCPDRRGVPATRTSSASTATSTSSSERHVEDDPALRVRGDYRKGIVLRWLVPRAHHVLRVARAAPGNRRLRRGLQDRVRRRSDDERHGGAPCAHIVDYRRCWSTCARAG